MPDPLVPPHNLEAEKSVLGAVLLDERHLDALTVECGLKPGHFYREQYGQVFAAMLALHARSSKIDHLTVAEQLREAGQLEAIGRTGVPRCGPPCIRDAAGTAPGDCWAIAGDRNRGKARARSPRRWRSVVGDCARPAPASRSPIRTPPTSPKDSRRPLPASAGSDRPGYRVLVFDEHQCPRGLALARGASRRTPGGRDRGL